MVEPEKFKARSHLEDHLHHEHHVKVPRKLLRLWTIDELVKAHEAGHRDMCTCLHTESGEMFVNSLCPIHGDVRDTGIIELCDLCGRPLPTGVLWVHTECADAENADDRITAIEDAIEELDR